MKSDAEREEFFPLLLSTKIPLLKSTRHKYLVRLHFITEYVKLFCKEFKEIFYMVNVNYAEDIVPLSSFRADMTRLMSQTKATHRPIVVTQNGRAANVFLDVADYQQLVDKLDLMMDIYKGEQDIAAGRVHSTDDVRRAIASDLGVSI